MTDNELRLETLRLAIAHDSNAHGPLPFSLAIEGIIDAAGKMFNYIVQDKEIGCPKEIVEPSKDVTSQCFFDKFGNKVMVSDDGHLIFPKD